MCGFESRRVHLAFYRLARLRAAGFFAFGVGGVASMRRKSSSNPTPLPSLCSALGEFCVGLGLDGFPDFVAGELGTIGQALACNVHQDHLLALQVVIARLDAVVPTEVELIAVPLQVLLADAVEGAVQAAL